MLSNILCAHKKKRGHPTIGKKISVVLLIGRKYIFYTVMVPYTYSNFSNEYEIGRYLKSILNFKFSDDT